MKFEHQDRLAAFREWAGVNGMNPAGTAEEMAQWREIYQHAENARRLHNDSQSAAGALLEFAPLYLGRKASGWEVGCGYLIHSNDDCRLFADAAAAEWAAAEWAAQKYGFLL